MGACFSLIAKRRPHWERPSQWVRVLTLPDDKTVQSKHRELQAKLERCGYPRGLVATAINSAMSLDKELLRVVKDKEPTSNDIAFVHTFDPGFPELFPRILGFASRLSNSRELKPIFGGTKVINSQREPSSLGHMLQHSRYEDSSVAVSDWGVKKCGHRGCGCCEDILEIKSYYFPNSGITYEIRAAMDCTVRNVIYCLQCKACSHTYIGETVNFRRRMSRHKSDSASMIHAAMEVSKHLCRCGMGFWRFPLFKVKEENKITRLVIEDKLVELLKPDLNRDQRNLLHLHTYRPHPPP